METDAIDVANSGQSIVKSGSFMLTGVELTKLPTVSLAFYDASNPNNLGTAIAHLFLADVTGSYPFKARLLNGLTIINGDAVQGSTVLTSNNTEVADGDTVTIDTVTYRFKNTPAQAYDVKRNGTTADTTLANLIKAINASGVGDGSDYFAGTLKHPTVFAGTTITAHHFPITSWAYGVAANSIATTHVGATLSFTGATLASGAEGGAYELTVNLQRQN